VSTRCWPLKFSSTRAPSLISSAAHLGRERRGQGLGDVQQTLAHFKRHIRRHAGDDQLAAAGFDRLAREGRNHR